MITDRKLRKAYHFLLENKLREDVGENGIGTLKVGHFIFDLNKRENMYEVKVITNEQNWGQDAVGVISYRWLGDIILEKGEWVKQIENIIEQTEMITQNIKNGEATKRVFALEKADEICKQKGFVDISMLSKNKLPLQKKNKTSFWKQLLKG